MYLYLASAYPGDTISAPMMAALVLSEARPAPLDDRHGAAA
jgi:hypothetical protein